MNARALPLVTVGLGLLTLAAFYGLGAQPVVRAVYSPSEIAPAVSAFQRAETLGDIARVFGYPIDEARVAAMDALNRVDLFAFIPAYALFLTAGAVMLGGLRNRWVQLAIAFAWLGAVADVVETSKQLQITADFADAGEHLPLAPWHWLKYAALALNGVAAASLCLTVQKRRLILAAIAFAPFPLVALSYMGAISTRVFAGAFTVYWLGLLVIAAMESVRGRGSPA